MDTISPTAATSANTQQRNAKLRQMVNDFVGVTFFEPMLKTAHNSVLKGKYGHGGRGEEIFQGQLDAELAKDIGRGVRTSLADRLYHEFGGKD